ncbi:RidA family protein [Nocardioides litoris]|uniref:RidA family protein n=1 Tax=Nocardioides litoris TaxID=1926648 RepID=UPI00111DE2B8|nr:RidA family protein [Nocardioides litoris]
MKSFLDPPGLPRNDVYRHVSLVPLGDGTRLVHVAGQVSWDAEGTLVAAGDLAGQVEQCYANVATALAAVGGTLRDVVDLTMYVADWRPELIGDVVAGTDRAGERLGGTSAPPATLVGVAALHVPEHLVELKAVAVVGDAVGPAA